MRPSFFFLHVLWTSLTFISCGNPGNGTISAPTGFDSTSVREGMEADSVQLPFEGGLILTLFWKDGAGQNTLVLSGKAAFPVDEDTQQTAFFAQAYVRNDSLPVPQWELVEVLDSCYCDCAIELAEGPIPVLDIDQDGIAEVFLMYFLNDLCDATPMFTKLSVASGKNVYGLEGYTRRFLAPGLPGVNVLSPGPTFESAPPAVQKAAYQFWEDYIRKEQAAFDNFKIEGVQNKD